MNIDGYKHCIRQLYIPSVLLVFIGACLCVIIEYSAQSTGRRQSHYKDHKVLLRLAVAFVCFVLGFFIFL